jgi:hypothetical protein
MDPQIAAAILGLLGGVVGGAIAAWAAFRLQRKASQNLEKDEVRKRRVEIIYNLLGSRYVLNDSYDASSEEVQVFNTAMALFSVYFANDREVSEAYDKFLNSKIQRQFIRNAENRGSPRRSPAFGYPYRQGDDYSER